MRSRDGKRKMVLRDQAQGLGAFHNLYIALFKGFKFLQVFRNCRRVDHEVDVGRQQGWVVLIMDCHAFFFELSGEWGRGAVIACHGIAVAVVVAGEGAHADAANA